MNVLDAITLQAFSLARLQLAPVLTSDLEDKIHEVGDRVAHHDPHVADDVRALVRQHTCLQGYYESAYNDLHRHYQTQERVQSFTPSTADVSAPGWERIVVEILKADSPLHTVRHLLRELKVQTGAFAAGMIGAFFTVLQKVLVDLDTHAIAVLKAISERPLSMNDLIRLLDGSDLHVQAVIHMLWQERYITLLNGSLFSRIQPFFCHSKRHQELDPDADLALTAKGHFMLHPVVTTGTQSAAVG
ncbi:MAG: hypothetical protein IGR76_07930 [Synechococcales cyanobacterium T60_A2020_003]|nr:hypothetical protein [Synechococcales cyanobacterium T60_A2020_003]